jgi:hypothetical protein
MNSNSLNLLRTYTTYNMYVYKNLNGDLGSCSFILVIPSSNFQSNVLTRNSCWATWLHLTWARLGGRADRCEKYFYLTMYPRGRPAGLIQPQPHGTSTFEKLVNFSDTLSPSVTILAFLCIRKSEFGKPTCYVTFLISCRLILQGMDSYLF